MQEKKSKMPKIGEAVFCIIYLIFGYCAGIYMLLHASGRPEILLYGCLTLVLAGGDSFHLVPRILDAFLNDFKKYEFYAGLGLMISSITMTIFYILLYYEWTMISGVVCNPFVGYFLWGFALTRMGLCFFPQNNWFKKEGNPNWGILRNVPFVVVGAIVVGLFIYAGMWEVAIAIIISFACYLPVVLWGKKIPMIGMLMIPKTMAYMWMIVIGLKLI